MLMEAVEESYLTLTEDINDLGDEGLFAGLLHRILHASILLPLFPFSPFKFSAHLAHHIIELFGLFDLAALVILLLP